MPKFEYQTLVYDTTGVFGGKINLNDFQNQLNILGQQGWELISSVATHQSYGSTRSIVSIFKRKIADSDY